MAEDRSYAGFIKWMAAALLAGVLLTVLLVVVVDPYRLFRLVDVAGFNAVKPRPDHYQAQIKLAGAQAMRPAIVLMGNSRVDVGIDPDSTQFGAASRPAYNLAIPGTGVGTSREQFEHLRAAGAAPATMLLGVEFFDFLLDPERADAPERPPPTGLARHRWRIDTAFSLDALLDAVKTLRIQHDADAGTMTARGFNPLFDYLRIAREEGYHAIFLQRARENARSFSQAPHGIVRTRSDSSAEWRDLGRLLDGAAREKTAIHLIIYPYHAQLLAMLEQTGLWPVFEQWKLRLAGEVARLNAAHPEARVVLWDFSGYGALQCEPIPAKGDVVHATRWYWESGHFKPALGELMLERIFGAAGAGPADAAFGFRLDAANRSANRDRIARERRECLAAQPAMFGDAAALVAEAQAGLPGRAR
ncbi:hypothetical protein SAMN05428959_105140 [Duganella sp. CF517]|uniref:hypothetical protein n=1 Tax=Duganella sp. CF517 TaxID=1881038 RepID=UPI0008CE0DD8|nr:hypothetical protein [Duganella sp. CF517]SEO17201.1 hypothetical protein SAMN05428959_105140 [Duganella sp. CF517]